MASGLEQATVRPYRHADREAVMRLAADSAAFGEPVEAFLEDRRLFCDAVYRYYLDYEPEHTWVAVVEPEVIGFLAGCTDGAQHARCLRTQIVPGLAWGLLSGDYRVGRRTTQYALDAMAAVIRREFPTVDLAQYPAHLHINVDAAWRGRGAGRRLIETYLEQLRSLGVPGVHLRTTNLNVAAVALYSRIGFRLLGARPTRLWRHVTDQPVENRCYGLRLK
jgi:ribosomal protein S18 acetylase RimI-like enzyme